MSRPLVILTGAGGDIGRATTATLAARGYAIAALDLSATALETIEASATNVIRIVADIRSLDSVRTAVAEAEAQFGGVAALVNNAGGISAPSLRTTSEEQWLGDLDLNLSGPFRCIHAVQEGMIERGRGVIVNISSVNGLGVFGHPGYSVAKAGLIHLTKFCATEFGKFGIRSVAICPGSVRTQAWDDRERAQPGILDEALSWYPARDVCRPQDVAEAIAAVLDDRFRMLNGAIITLDGGLIAGSDRVASLFTGNTF